MRNFFLVTLILLTVFTIGCSSPDQTAIESEILWTNNNILAVENGPTNPTIVTLEEDSIVTGIVNYHYFNNGVKPGTISLIGEDGTEYGPWQAEGREGQGNVENAYWVTSLNLELKAGNYTVVDSDPGTWSHNDDSENRGFTEVRGKLK